MQSEWRNYMIKSTSDFCRIRLQGTVITMSVSSKVSRIRIATDAEKSKDVNLPEIIVYSSALLKGISYGTKITVIGHAQMANIRQRDGSYKPNTIIVADNIRIAPRRLLEYFDPSIIIGDEGGIVEDINEFAMIGRIVSTIEYNGVVHIRILIEDNKGQNRQCDLSCFKKQAEFVNLIENNTKVACCGYVSTNKKEVNGEMKYYQNLICRDIAVVNVSV